MKFEYFIARKILKNEVEGKKVSRPIVRIAIISISLAMLVNLITIAVVTGFQKEVRDKVIGFGSHAVVQNAGETSVFESAPILKNQAFYPILEKRDEVVHIQPVAYKPALLQSEEMGESQQKEILGVMVKGVDARYDWKFFKSHLKEGRIPNFTKEKMSDEILISSKIAQNLNYKLGDQVRAFFVKSQPVKELFTVVGIFETGLEDFDKELVFADIRQVQTLNDWGIKANISVADSLINGHLVLGAEVQGGNGNYRYDWGKGFEKYRGLSYYPDKDTVIRLIVSDYWVFIDGQNEQTSIPDTAYLEVKVSGNAMSRENYPLDSEGKLKREFDDELGFKFHVQMPTKRIDFQRIDGKGSSGYYVGAFEFTLRDWDHLKQDVNFLKKQIQFQPGNEAQDLRVSSIVDTQNDIFVWLSFLDVNVWIILILMLLIGIINMGSALLVMILVKSNFIGLLKAMGAKNWQIRKIFLIQAGFLIARGMLWGNLIGLGFCLLQGHFKFLKLNPEIYYLNAVPVELSWSVIILLNVITLVVCLCALLIPSYVITRISPVKAIRFN